jgi:hypothetical protein
LIYTADIERASPAAIIEPCTWPPAVPSIHPGLGRTQRPSCLTPPRSLIGHDPSASHAYIGMQNTPDMALQTIDWQGSRSRAERRKCARPL